MKKLQLLCFGLFIILYLGDAVYGRGDQSAIKSAADIAKELANPNAALGTFAFPVDYIRYGGDLDGASDQNGLKINIQPSLPYPIAKGVNLFARPLIPVVMAQPYYTGNGFESAGVNLGDISADVAVGKTWPSRHITILGVFGSFPTATKDELGSGRTMLGPEFMWAFLGKKTVIGLLINHSWSASGNSDGSLSITGGQYFYVINLKNAWQITGQPTWSYVHNAPEGSRLTFPLGIGLNKTIIAGNTPIKFSLQYWYYVATPESFGPKHQIRFMVSPVLPLPW